MATKRTRSLKLYLSSGLTTEARANLEILDRLGDVYYVDNTESVLIRSKQNITLLPGDPSVGGSGGASLTLGTTATPLNTLTVNAGTFEMNGDLKLGDKASGAPSTSKLTVQYKSDVSGAADTAARKLSLDVNGADRGLALGGDFILTSGLTVAGGGYSITIPSSGTVVMTGGTQTLTGKVIDADANILTNIDNADIKVGAAIDAAKIADGSVSNTEFQYLDGATSNIQAQLNSKQPNGNYITALTGDVVAAGPGSVAATIQPASVSTAKLQDLSVTDAKVAAGLSRSKVAAGTPNAVVMNDGSGLLTSSTILPKANGGAGADMTAVTFPGSGVLVTEGATQTLTGKTISGASNTITSVPYSSLVLSNSIINADVASSAAIAYSKLNLSGSITNSDVNVSANISGTKVNPDFGNQTIKTTDGIQFSEGGYTTKVRAAQSGQLANLTFSLPPNYGTSGYVLTTNGVGDLVWTNPSSGGTVTSVALTAPSQFVVSGSPITTSGTLGLAWQNQSANVVLAGPATGIPSAPTFRSLVAADLPSHTHVAADVTDFSEAVDDRVAALVQNTPSVSWSYNDAGNTLSATVSLSPFSTTNLAEGTNLYYTNTRVYNKAKNVIVGGAGISATSADGPETVTLAVDFSEFTTDSLVEGTTNLFLTDERVQDVVGAMSINSADIQRAYDDLGNTISWALTTTAVTPGSYGSSSSVGTFTVDSKGRLTAAGSASITPASIDAQPVDGDLTAVAGLSGTGFISRTATDTMAVRTLTAGTGLSVTNGDGVSGNPSVALANTTVSAGSYGSATAVGTFTVDAQGRLTAASSTTIAIPSSQLTDKGAANGVATLDGSGKVPVSQLPNAIMEYQGTWNASTNTPTLADGAGNSDPSIGNVYRVSVAGTQNLGSGSITFDVGDYVILNASKVWEKADTTDAVASVNGLTGAVVLTTTNVSEGTNLYYTSSRFTSALAATRFKTDWVTADGTTKVVTHNLGTRDVIVQLYDGVTYETITVDNVVRTTINSVTLTASEAPGTSWRILIEAV